ncbi:hypothetical protein [Arthrobacter sp. 260]|uniref:hypothetical protein n=1 Tax=Arthrobacter sp. 260 TaxID=2735314 RepID=UPI001491B60C|nr:hypothetical protein [Arthrobacter sp. 260]NOJ60315.1 hypothetical protein [Arthrobacter sp. 260]
MSTDPTQPHERRQAPEPDTTRATAEPVQRTETPEAVQAANVVRRPGSATSQTGACARRVRGAEWVRPTDLIARHGAAVAGRGIDFEVELARRSRHLPGRAVRAGSRGVTTVQTAVSERARRLPSVPEFGRTGGPQSWVTRSGIGLG